MSENNNTSLNLIFENAKERMKICRTCPRLFQPTRTCLECGCFMLIKTKVPNVECPLGHWGKMDFGDDSTSDV